MDQLLHQQTTLGFDKKKSRFLVCVAGHSIEQNVCEFLLTSSFLVGQNPEEYLLSTDSRYDTVKIPMTMAGRTITLDLSDFLHLREVYSHQHYLLKLEDLLLHRGIRFQ